MESYNLVIEKPKEITFFEGYGYTYVLNNPLKYTDPSGYVYSNKRIEWENSWTEGQDMYYAMMQINAEWMDRMRRRGGGGGGSYADRINNLHSDPRGWNYNPYTNQYENSRTGESIDVRNKNAFDRMGVDYDRFIIYEIAYSVDGQKSFIGTGKFGVIHEGIMKSTGIFPTFSSKSQGTKYANSLENNRHLFNSEIATGLGILGISANSIKEARKFSKAIGINGNYVGKVLKIGGPGLTFTSMYFSGAAYSRGEISAGKLMADIGIGFYSFIPGYGTAAAFLYTGIDILYPGGIEGFSKNYASYYSNYVDKVGYFPRY